MVANGSALATVATEERPSAVARIVVSPRVAPPVEAGLRLFEAHVVR